MKISTLFPTFLTAIALNVPVTAAEKSDLLPPQRRQQTVEIAERLMRPPVPAPLPPGLIQPFNPEGFDQPDPEDIKANPSARAPSAGDAPAQVVPLGDQQLLETLAARIPSSGTINLGGKPMLVVGKHRLEVGQTVTVVDPANGREYDLELVAIGSTTFTLRYRGVVTTRPIRPTK